VTQWQSWHRSQCSVPRAELSAADSSWKNCAPCSSRQLSAQGLADIHPNTSTPACHALYVSPSINQMHRNCLPTLSSRHSTPKSPGRSGAGVVLVTASAGSTLSWAAPLLASALHAALLYPCIAPAPGPGGTHGGGSTTGVATAPTPPPCRGAAGTELPHLTASPGKRHRRGGLERASQQARGSWRRRVEGNPWPKASAWNVRGIVSGLGSGALPVLSHQ